MNRRDFFRGLLATAAIIPTVSTKTIIDIGANTWRPTPATLGIGTTPTPGEFYRCLPQLAPFSAVDPQALWAAVIDFERSRKRRGNGKWLK